MRFFFGINCVCVRVYEHSVSYLKGTKQHYLRTKKIIIKFLFSFSLLLLLLRWLYCCFLIDTEKKSTEFIKEWKRLVLFPYIWWWGTKKYWEDVANTKLIELIFTVYFIFWSTFALYGNFSCICMNVCVLLKRKIFSLCSFLSKGKIYKWKICVVASTMTMSKKYIYWEYRIFPTKDV